MIYPAKFENKIGFSEVRTMLRGRCLSGMGVDEVGRMTFLTDAEKINKELSMVSEMRAILSDDIDFPTQHFQDLRPQILRLQIKGTYLDEQSLFALRNTMDMVGNIVKLLRKEEPKDFGETVFTYPLLSSLAQSVPTFPRLIIQVDSILNNYGHVKDDASPDLLRIRRSLAGARKAVTISLKTVLLRAQESGLVEKDVNPTYRDGRLVIPVKPEVKRRIRGIVHDESATGKTVFIEPTEVVEANNRIRSLEAEEQRAVTLILQAMAEIIRPQLPDMISAFSFLGRIDFIRAKAIIADKMDAVEPHLASDPLIDWAGARHPLLESALTKQGRQIVPQDIVLTPNNRILLISGPNAGGKSVCLKTVALLQYMMQCGMSVPMARNSKTGVFESLFLDIGDEQSIENDLSTYSSHLLNMKNTLKNCNDHSLVMIDEMGNGTEPQIGAAITQAILDVFLQKQTYGVITTHFQSLKYYADNHEGIVNAAMLYDRHEMRPLFSLEIGNPGSSFAIEIARNIGLPQSVIDKASEIVGDDYIKSDKYLQDIVRDKRYWENKRTAVHKKERALDQLKDTYEQRLAALTNERKAILDNAKAKAEDLFRQSNAAIENTIRSIREAQAEKEETKHLREELNEMKKELLAEQEKESDSDAIQDIESDIISSESVNRKIEQIKRRQQRREERKRAESKSQTQSATGANALSQEPQDKTTIEVGSFVKIPNSNQVGQVIKLNDKEAVVQTGMIKLSVGRDKLIPTSPPPKGEAEAKINFIGRSTREAMQEKSMHFQSNIDVRGMSGQEALEAVTYFIEDAIQCGAHRLTILHGTGTGYLRQVIRQYLRSVPAVASYHDEDVRFGGAGITVVEMDY